MNGDPHRGRGATTTLQAGPRAALPRQSVTPRGEVMNMAVCNRYLRQAYKYGGDASSGMAV